jgi:RND superfamily putative drug exporter
MSNWLRLALAPAHRRLTWLVLSAWLVIAVIAVIFAGKVGEIESSDVRNWLPAGAESTSALDLADAEFTADEPESLLVLYIRDAGITAADRVTVQADADALAPLAAAAMPPPASSADGKALLLSIPLTPQQVAQENIAAVIGQVRAVVAGQPAGLDAWISGGSAVMADFDAAFDSLDTTLLLVTVTVVAVLLLLTYRSPVLLVIPLITVVVAGRLANALVYLCGRFLNLTVDGASTSILMVLLFGAGTDYALLLISRYREELRRHADRHTAMRHAMRRTLPAVSASAATVVLALLALLFADLNSTRGLGPVAAIGIISALLAMTTLLPAMLVVCGRWVFWPVIPAFQAAAAATEPAATGPWHRLAGLVARRVRPVWIGSAVVLTALTPGIATISTGLSESGFFVTKPDSVRGGELLGVHFAAGSATPTDTYAPAGSASEVATAAGAVPGVALVRPPQPSRTGAWVRIPVVLTDDPGSAPAQQTIVALREAVHAVEAKALVGGPTAEALDQDRTMDRDLLLVIPLILVIVALVLMVLLRCVVAPALLLGSVVLSAGASLGATALIFIVVGFPTIEKSLLLNGFLFLVALGVDYTIFLMTRAREEVGRLGHRHGVRHALATTGAVITSAGLVLAATFSVLSLMPLVFMMQLGVLVAVGVLLDTFVVRTFLVPALVLAVGPRSWWPSRLTVESARDTLPDADAGRSAPITVR